MGRKPKTSFETRHVGSRGSASLPLFCAKPKAEDENDDEDDWGSKQAGTGKETLARVIAMQTRLIDRFETNDTRDRGS